MAAQEERCKGECAMTKASVKAGDRITWTHYSAPGPGWQEPFERSGTVWSGAPVGNSLANAWWVHPDEALPGETLVYGCLLAVGKAAGDYKGRGWTGSGPRKGEVYSSGYWAMQPAALTAAAISHSKREAAEKAARAMTLAA
jgi:hypothetical protein